MTQLFLHGRLIGPVFELLGENENDITYSVGWALSRSPSFLRTFLDETVGYKGETAEAIVRLQDYRKTGGITDIEVELPGQLYVVVEAKKGWSLPSVSQLEKYVSRYGGKNSPVKKILVLSECSLEYARHNLGLRLLKGVPVEPVSWKAIVHVAERAAAKRGHREKHLLGELLAYLRRVTTVQNIESNWVYVVALSHKIPPQWQISFTDIVNKRQRYFHPVGTNGWPKDPPNYIAFRYEGRLQSVHHIEEYEVFTRIHDYFPEIPNEEWDPHYLYKLGPAIQPGHEVRTGNIYPNGRVWCMLDALLTCKTVSEARDLSKKREDGTRVKVGE